VSATANLERHYSADEAAKLIGMPKRRLWDLCRQEKLRHVRVGRSVLIPESALKEFLAARTVPCAPGY
jgi:excisionase family DNA binding protein